MELGYKVDIDPLRVGRMTPAELNICVAAKAEKEQETYRSYRYVSWLTAALGRSKKMPSLETFLRNQERKRVDPEWARDELRSIYQEMGVNETR